MLSTMKESQRVRTSVALHQWKMGSRSAGVTQCICARIATQMSAYPNQNGRHFHRNRPTLDSEETDEPATKRLAISRPSSSLPIPIPLSSENSNRAGPSGYHPPDESEESRARSVRRILYSSDEEDAEAASAQLIAEQEAARRRKKKLQVRRAALQFIDSMAAVEDEEESEQEFESDSTDSDDSFIVGDDVCD